MQLFLGGENPILYVTVRCNFRTVFSSCSMHFQGTWNPFPLPIVLKRSMRNIRVAIKKSTSELTTGQMEILETRARV